MIYTKMMLLNTVIKIDKKNDSAPIDCFCKLQMIVCNSSRRDEELLLFWSEVLNPKISNTLQHIFTEFDLGFIHCSS